MTTVCRFVAGMLLRGHDDPDDAMMSELLGIGVDTENDEIDTVAFDERSKESPEYTLLVTAYASFDAEGVNYFWWRWDLRSTVWPAYIRKTKVWISCINLHRTGI